MPSVLGCSCKNKCGPTTNCCNTVAKKPFAYRHKNNSKQLSLKYSHSNKIIECGDHCHCDINCPNRVTQRSSQYDFGLFKTIRKGWGVKTYEEIMEDAFLFEYTGEFILPEEADFRHSMYMYEIESNSGKDYTIDASVCGSLARFVNHSCRPNAEIYWVNDCRQLPENA